MKKIAIVSSSNFRCQFIHLLLEGELVTLFSNPKHVEEQLYDIIIYAPIYEEKIDLFPTHKLIVVQEGHVNPSFTGRHVPFEVTNPSNVKRKIWMNIDQIHFEPADTLTGGVVAIGSSTGGPLSLQAVLNPLPATFDVPIVIAQHMPADFTRVLARRLDQIVEIRVKEARHLERLEAGTAYVAPGGKQMTIHVNAKKDAVIHINEPGATDLYHPSINYLFESVALYEWKIAVLLTGMGSDGAGALSKLKQSSQATIIAESQQTATIFGIPNAAIKTGLVDEILPNEEIGEWLAKKGGKP
ncbi:CheB methylesterase domain-containing protein [Bacillus sp. JCM 19041]|uniref:CheB methylesterase domain-containing protein n=1 Tax=Bacillus sp. JCM 19041 TaxID=1460637 RepID=UPI0006D0CBBF